MKFHLKDNNILFAFDIGNTIIVKNKSFGPTSKTLDSIKKMMNKGIKVGVCTFRTYDECKRIIPIKLDFYICCNGSYIVVKDKVIINDKIDLDIKNNHYMKVLEDKYYVETKDAMEVSINNGYMNSVYGNPVEYNNILVYDVETPDSVESIDNYNYEYWNKDKILLIQSKRCSKLDAIDLVLNYWNNDLVPVYIADGINDLAVFQKYSTCIAMGNSYPLLHEFALFTTKTCEEEGFSFAVEKLLKDHLE